MSQRIPLPVLAPDPTPLVPCTACGKCCTDGSGEWSVHFETRCRHLGDDLLCRVYAERPHICRAFDNTTCEVNSPDGKVLSFTTPEQFLAWLERTRPRVFRSIVKRYVPERLKKKEPPPGALEETR
jgi:Fe-S-cluster containining protein